MEKLTQQIAMRYPFCRVKTCNNWTGYVGGYHKDIMTILADDDLPFNRFEYKYSDCQLILKPLSKISDDDAIKVAIIYEKIMSKCDDDEDRVIIGKGLIMGFICNTNSFHFSYWGKTIDFLRSKHYDVDNLISQGIAVEE